MKNEMLSAGAEVNIDVANEEIQRLSAKLGVKSPDFIPGIYEANEKITELNAEVAKKGDVVVRPALNSNLAPRPTDPPTRRQPQATGLMRSIEANVASKGRPVHTTSSSFRPTGLSRAIEANIKHQRSKPQD